MKTVNKVILVGQVSGVTPVSDRPDCVRFEINTLRPFSGGDLEDAHPVVACEAMGAFAGRHVVDGARIYLEGMLEQFSADVQGEQVRSSHIRAVQIVVLNSGT